VDLLAETKVAAGLGAGKEPLLPVDCAHVPRQVPLLGEALVALSTRGSYWHGTCGWL
jgi:hypothetical protein